MAATTLNDLINPEVMADMISAKIEKAIVVTPFAKIDNTLVGQPGATITVPQYDYIGDAVDVLENGEMPERTLTTKDAHYTVKKAGNGVTLSDEAVLSGYGNPVGETNSQLAKSIASKIDTDAIGALCTSAHEFVDTTNKIKYESIVDAIAVFDEELNTEKVMFVNPQQVATLRKDANFISADKYPANVIMTGEIGKIANTRIVASRRVAKFDKFFKYDAAGKEIVKESPSASQVALADVIKTLPSAQVGDKVTEVSTPSYFCPIVKIEADERTEDEVPAITIYKKRDVMVETERDTHHKNTYISADQHYTAALTNASKVVVAKIKA